MTTQPIPLRPQPDNPAAPIYRAVWANFIAACEAAGGRGATRDEAAVCRDLFPNDSTALRIVQKAAASPGTTGTAGWAAELAQQATSAFLGSLAQSSAAASLMARGLTVPLDRHNSAVIPGRASAPTAASGVEEGAPIPMRVVSVASVTLSPKRVGAIVALSRELSRRAAGMAVMETLLREDASVSLDSVYFSTSAGSATTHPGLLYGVTAGQSGDMPTVLGELAAAVSASGSGEVAFVMHPSLAAPAPIRAPQMQVTILPSIAAPVGRVIAVDPQSVVHCFGPDPGIDASETAVLHMADPAAPLVASATTADPVRSLWQTAAIGVRMQIDIGFAKRTSTAVAYADGVVWP